MDSNIEIINRAITLLQDYINDIDDEVSEGLRDPDDADAQIEEILEVIRGLKNL